MKHTPGPWRIGPAIFEGDVIYAPPQHEGRRNEVIAMGILNKADAVLISLAPKMLELLRYFHYRCYSEDLFNFRVVDEKITEQLNALLKIFKDEVSE